MGGGGGGRGRNQASVGSLEQKKNEETQRLFFYSRIETEIPQRYTEPKNNHEQNFCNFNMTGEGGRSSFLFT